MSELRVSEPRYRILIVDDDDDVREALEDELEPRYEVTAVSSGREALRLLDSDHFDAIISDQRMPGMSGVNVLSEALGRDSDLVRILLTGYVDVDARRAMMEENAPYKIGKPWHDEVEVTLKRAFENRARERDLNRSVTDALAIAGIDNELATAGGLSELARIVVRRCLSLQGVYACEVRISDEHQERTLAGDRVSTEASEKTWLIDMPISVDGNLRLIAQGEGATAKSIVDYLAVRALHWSSEDSATRLAKQANSNPAARELLSAVSRRATIGTMTVALVHELASMVQSLQGSLFELEDFVHEHANEQDDPEVIETLQNAVGTSTRIVALFRSMRTFVRAGDTAHRPCKVKDLVESSVALCRGSLRSVINLEIGPIPDAEIEANEALFLQVLVNLLRNAAEASPPNATVHLNVERDEDTLVFSVRDHGAGVAEDLIDEVFEPFTSTKPAHSASGLGLAISSEIILEHRGHIRYQHAEGGGALFTVTVPAIVA